MAARRTITALCLFGLIYAYLAFEFLFASRFGWGQTGACLTLLAFPFGMILWLPLNYWRDDTPPDSFGRTLAVWLSYFSMAVLSFILVLTLSRDILFLLSEVFRAPRATSLYSPLANFCILALTGLCIAFGVWNAFFNFKVSEIQISLPKLPADFEGFKLVQLSDIHIGPTIQKRFVTRLVNQVNRLDADLIAITGDSIDGLVQDLATPFSILGELRSKHGSFYVTGNHEYYWEAEAWIEKAKAIGLIPLVNEHRLISRGQATLAIAGVADVASAHFPGSVKMDLAQPLVGIAPGTVKILLSHQPETAKAAANLGYDLQLSGHTHAGQFIPWTWVIHLFHDFARGLHRVDQMWLYVSRGTGHWGPPVRLGAAPEITRFTLSRK